MKQNLANSMISNEQLLVLITDIFNNILLGNGFQTKIASSHLPLGKHWHITVEIIRKQHWTPKERSSALFRHLYKLACHLLMSNWEDEELLARTEKVFVSLGLQRDASFKERKLQSSRSHIWYFFFYHKHGLYFYLHFNSTANIKVLFMSAWFYSGSRLWLHKYSIQYCIFNSATILMGGPMGMQTT